MQLATTYWSLVLCPEPHQHVCAASPNKRCGFGHLFPITYINFIASHNKIKEATADSKHVICLFDYILRVGKVQSALLALKATPWW